ncbi:hypothetical protein GGR57DRAFT_466426 [Xylariaceae sp. FL1272]|nr:hypothetical protein GGR57DRAFT_466426 [Xylariaceae sp. FL1272]
MTRFKDMSCARFLIAFDSLAPLCDFSLIVQYVKKIINQLEQSISGLVVKSIVAIDGPRVRFAADASFLKNCKSRACLIMCCVILSNLIYRYVRQLSVANGMNSLCIAQRVTVFVPRRASIPATQTMRTPMQQGDSFKHVVQHM